MRSGSKALQNSQSAATSSSPGSQAECVPGNSVRSCDDTELDYFLSSLPIADNTGSGQINEE
eukprot:11768319-Karenia_brevis.AAC.1